MKNILLNLKHFLKMRFSEKYRKQEQLNRGEQIWSKLDANLPKLTGEENVTKYRIVVFKARVSNLKSDERTDLRAYIDYQVYNLTHNFTEHTTYTTEEIERKALLKYQLHQEALNELKEKYGI